jgi:uncharacterized protein
VFYLDTSAAVKLVVVERGTAAMRRWLEQHIDRVASSDVLRVELLRTVRREAPDRLGQAVAVLEVLLLMRVAREDYEQAARLEPPRLHSLDALHLACALELGEELEGIVTYDERLAESARANGIATVAPR